MGAVFLVDVEVIDAVIEDVQHGISDGVDRNDGKVGFWSDAGDDLSESRPGIGQNDAGVRREVVEGLLCQVCIGGCISWRLGCQTPDLDQL